MAGDGVANPRIVAALGVNRPVLNWLGRFLANGLDSAGKVRPGANGSRRSPRVIRDRVVSDRRRC